MPDRIFISYARRDARTLALRLQADLIGAGYDVWLDTSEIDGGASWSREIEDAIESCDCGLALLSHGAFESEICRAEQLRLLRKRKRVIPLLVQADAERPLHLEALNYRSFSDDAQYTAALDLLRADLAGKGDADVVAPPATPTNADPLPPEYIVRAELLDSVRAAVLDDATDRRVALTALQGMGGIGKSVLASAICHDDAVRDAYPDGVIWVKVGQTPGSLVPHMRLIGKLLGDAEHHYSTDTEAESRLRTYLPAKSALIVLDDVWDVRHVLPFVVEARRCRVLFTTRDAGIARDTRVGAAILTVHEMKPAEALDLLQQTTGIRTPELADIAREVGYHPLALSLAGGRIKNGMSPADWLSAYHETRKIVARRGANDRHTNIEACFDLSIAALDDADRPLYHALGIFPDDVWIPRAAITRLWAASGLSQYDALDLIERLVELALVEQRLDDGALTLHDLLHDYNLTRLPNPAAIHTRLIEAWGDPYALPDRFAWTWYAYHLIGARQPDRLRGYLLDYRWLRAKLNAADVNALIVDCDYLHADDDVRLLRSALTNASHILTADPRQLAGQLTGRLLIHRDAYPALATLLENAALLPDVPADLLALLPTTASLTQAGSALLRTLTGHSGGVGAVAWSPDGTRLVSASADGTLKLWDVATATEMLTLSGHTSVVNMVAWSPDGRCLASASNDYTLRLWDAVSGDELRTVYGHTGAVTAVAWSPDGTRFVSASDDRTIKLWNAMAGMEVRTLTGHLGAVLAVAWSPNGKCLVSGSWDKTVKMWDAEAGIEVRTLTGHIGAVLAVAWSSDGKCLVSGSWDKTVKMWDAEAGMEVRTLTGHTGVVMAVAWSPDGTRVVSASEDGTLRLWNVVGGTLYRTLSGHAGEVNTVAWSPDGTRIASASDDRMLKLWDAAGMELQALPGHGDAVLAVSWSPDGAHIISGARDTTLKLWDGAGTELQTLTRHTDAVGVAVWSPDGTRILSASWDMTLKVWDVAGTELRTFFGHTSWVNAAAWSPDGTRILSGSDDRTLKVWDSVTGTELKTLRGHTWEVNAVAWSLDGTRIVSGARDNMLKLWNVATGMELRTLTGHTGTVLAVAWSPDGTRIVSGARDRTLKLWDMAVGTELRTFIGHTNWVNGLAWSPDGTRIVSASYDMTLRLWDADSGAQIARFDLDAAVLCATWSPDGRMIAAGDEVGQVHILRVVG